MLAEAAGFDDGERWWEFVVESRRDGADMFAAIREAMAEVRVQVPAQDDLRELQREARMLPDDPSLRNAKDTARSP